MRKPSIIKCPASCGHIRVNRYKKRCPGCKTKLFYSYEVINPSDPEDMDGFIWIKTKWVNVREWLNKHNIGVFNQPKNGG